MKRKNILKILLFIVAIVVMPKKVFASSCAPLTESHHFVGGGECNFELTEDLEFDSPIQIDAGTVTINLNGHNITSSSHAFYVTESGSLTITGEGTVSTTSQTSLAILFESTGSLTINGGTYAGGLHAQNGNEVTINNGTFNGNTTTGFGTTNIENLTINNGTFNGTYYGASIYNVVNARINGGVFTGGKFGLQTNNTSKKMLYGGTYKSTDDESYAIIIRPEEQTDNDFYNSIVGDNYHYSNKFNVVKKNISEVNFGLGSSSGGTTDTTEMFAYVANTKNVSVVEGAPTEDQKIVPYTEAEEEAEEANPKTGSMLFIYVIAFLLVSGITVFGTYSYRKKLNK